MKDYFGYERKTVVVTGAASGMGKAAAEMLVDLGAKVYALDYNEVKVEGIESFIQVDLSEKESIDHAFTLIPDHINSFFGIAGISGMGVDFTKTVKVDFVSNKYMCETYLVNRMSQGGSIAFMTSTGGNGWEREDNKAGYMSVIGTEGWEATVEALSKTPFVYLPGTLGYPFSKLAMNYYTIYIQKLFAPLGIRVNAVLPGSTDTGMKDQFEAMAGGMDALLSHCGHAHRLARSEEMAQPIVFINSQLASYISGELLIVDYGQTGEEVAGIQKVAQPISLMGILEYMKSQQKQ